VSELISSKALTILDSLNTGIADSNLIWNMNRIYARVFVLCCPVFYLLFYMGVKLGASPLDINKH
jgi:hypothetical protein